MNSKKIRLCNGGVLAGMVFLFLSCTGNTPEIERLFWQLDIYMDPQTEEQYERLNVFVFPVDRDGWEDIAMWELHQDSRELVWRGRTEEMRMVKNGESSWLGSNGIEMPFRETIPRGEYVVKITDRAGEEAERDFFVPMDLKGLREGSIDEELFPRLRNTSAHIEILSSYSFHTVSVRDIDGKIVEVVELGERRIAKQKRDQWISEGGYYITIGAFHTGIGVGLKSGPYFL